MLVNGGKFISLTICLLVSRTQIQEAIAQTPEAVSQQCLDCICQAASGCDTLTGCKDDVCGPYRITEPYWLDGGKPTVDNDVNSPDGGFGRCVGDRSCASRAVQGYMNRYARDCNGDGVINCEDYILIHRLGNAGCTGSVAPDYQNAYRTCMSGGSPQPYGGMQPGGSPQAYGGQPGGSPQGYGGQPGASPQAYGGQPGASPQAYGGQPGGIMQQPPCTCK